LDLSFLSAEEIRGLILKREISAEEVLSFFLDRLEALEPRIRATLHITLDRALERAREVDRRIASGERPRILAGVPVAVKDNICIKGVPTTCASRILENWRPPYDAYVVSRLDEEGAVIFCKTNLDEFAMGSSTENSAFQITRNPYDPERVPGGSSGGSAALVAAGMAPLALGSDTGGSIRQPAALCGVVGLKPTYGLVSRYGLVAFASSLDQIGPFARNVRDAALLLQAVAGHDPHDSTSVPRRTPDFLSSLGEGVSGIRIGVPKEYFTEGQDPEVRDAIVSSIDVFEDLGADVEEISLPHTEYAIATYYIVATAEASSNLARYDGVHYGYRAGEFDGGIVPMYSESRREGFGAEVKRRVMLGTYVLSAGYYDAYYLKALKVRNLIKKDFDEAFKSVDLIVCPTSPTPAFKVGEKVEDPLAMYLSDIYTISANLAGIPGISIPCGYTEGGLPIGLQIMGNLFSEELLFRAADAFEKNCNLQWRRPRVG